MKARILGDWLLAWVTRMGHYECSWCPEEVESVLVRGSLEGPRGRRVQNICARCKKFKDLCSFLALSRLSQVLM